MQRTTRPLKATAHLILSVCDNLSERDTQILNGVAGTQVARNTRTGDCAYARSDGTNCSAPCWWSSKNTIEVTAWR